MAGGRPTKFNTQIKKQVKSLVLLGLTDKQVAEGIGVTEQTLNNWKLKHPKFFESLKDWKAEADKEIERSLRDRAKGYNCPETKVFNNNGEIITEEITRHYPPDPTSMIFWLKNRHPDKWRDKQEISGDMNLNIVRKGYDEKETEKEE